jgi:uncharacterized membrane protein YcaP (DUF421 family)
MRSCSPRGTCIDGCTKCMHDMFFHSWFDIWRIVLVGTLGYFGLVFFMRVSGKRSLSKLNSFDFLITVAFGSTLATLLLVPEVSLAEGLAAFALLISLQFFVSWTSVRVPLIKRIVTAEPAMVFFDGTYLTAAMRRNRVLKAEILAVIRQSGYHDIHDVYAVVMETEGSFSVIPRKETVHRSVIDESVLRQSQGSA